LHLHVVDESYDACEKKVDAHARAKSAEHDEKKKKGVVANAAAAAAVGYYCFHDDTHHLERRWWRDHRLGSEWYHMGGQIYRVVVAFAGPSSSSSSFVLLISFVRWKVRWPNILSSHHSGRQSRGRVRFLFPDQIYIRSHNFNSLL
jgi:hypothetical protein